MKSQIVFRVVILGIIAIIGIISIQSYWMVSSWRLNEDEFNQKVKLSLYNVAGSLAEASDAELPPRNIVKQRTSNYFIVNIEDEINPEILEHFLQGEFESKGLYIDFEYAVFDCTTDEMVYGNYVSFSPKNEKALKPGDLPKDKNFTYYFGVKFPTRPSYLWSKMQLPIIFSFILSVTLLFFAYSLYVILKQKRLSELQKDFINNMTHEFKTPISTIKISTDVLMNSEPVKKDERLSRYASIIKDQQERLNRQVEKVLQLAKIEKGNFELKCEEMNLFQVLEESLASLQVRLEKNKGKVQANIEAADVTIFADKLHLVNILNNLYDNAIKYCGQSPEIIVNCSQIEHQIQVDIQDNGIGISPENQTMVFEKFYRVPTGNIHNVKGFGLGLYYVKSICKSHNWELSLSSQEGVGTTISLLMPMIK